MVGTARDLTLNPRTCSGGSLILFKLTPDGAKLEHVHTVSEPGHLLCTEYISWVLVFPSQTPLDDVPVAMEPFQGRLLVGVGRLLRIYDIGKKKLLRKCENKVSQWRTDASCII